MAGTGVFAEVVNGAVFKYGFDLEWKKSASASRRVHFKLQACSKEEGSKSVDAPKIVSKSMVKSPLWKEAEPAHKASTVVEAHRSSTVELVKEVPAPVTYAVTELAGSGVFSEILDGQVYKYYSNGAWKRSTSGISVPITNPTTRKTQYKVQACTQEEVNEVLESAKNAQKVWAKVPLWKRAQLLHKVADILKEHKAPIAECLVREVAKPAKDAVTEVVRSGDLVSYCAEEGVRVLAEGTFLTSDCFPGNERSKYCIVSKTVITVRRTEESGAEELEKLKHLVFRDSWICSNIPPQTRPRMKVEAWFALKNLLIDNGLATLILLASTRPLWPCLLYLYDSEAYKL